MKITDYNTAVFNKLKREKASLQEVSAVYNALRLTTDMYDSYISEFTKYKGIICDSLYEKLFKKYTGRKSVYIKMVRREKAYKAYIEFINL